MDKFIVLQLVGQNCCELIVKLKCVHVGPISYGRTNQVGGYFLVKFHFKGNFQGHRGHDMDKFCDFSTSWSVF